MKLAATWRSGVLGLGFCEETEKRETTEPGQDLLNHKSATSEPQLGDE